VAITRRSFLAGLGSVSVGLLFHRRLDRVLKSLERDLADEPLIPDQLPAAAEIVVQAQFEFRPRRLVVPAKIAPLFVIENIYIGKASQMAAESTLSAEMFTADRTDVDLALDTATPGVEMRFRVRYVGRDPRGERFQAALVGTDMDGRWGKVLPIDSGSPIGA
jgi:hypothetical protein